MERGLYETLISRRVASALSALPAQDEVDLQPVDDVDQPQVLARHLHTAVLRTLESTRDPHRRIELTNLLLAVLDVADDEVAPPARELRSILAAPTPGLPALTNVRPLTPLAEAALLTNTRGEPTLGSELRAELDTSDEVDLLCAFVKWHGLRLLEPELSRLRDRGAPFRVITTAYIGATDRGALDRLVRDFGAEVKISYDNERTRLHAKAWMFRRATTFDTAYVGSSNLSRAALLDGVEWNVRLSRVGTPALLEKFRATFDTYWNDASFEAYDPDRDRDRLDDALAQASGHAPHDRVTLSLSGLMVRAFPYQQQMLDDLAVEREVHDRHRNLVVAATGTGKTVVAALDYRQLCDAAGEQLRLLFVAHRKEILEQSLRTYREVLNDANFGELYVGGTRPERWRHVFASVQSLTSYGVTTIPSDAFQVVVVDEFHHAEAATYRKLLAQLTPLELLGLTATPERSDWMDVRTFFGGRIATELRLWDALGADLLCPFHYFALADGTDLRQVRWSRGRYDDAQLDGLYTGNRARAALILKQVDNLVSDPGRMRALGFCVSVAHAQFMARVFNEAGLPARAVSGATPPTERADALRALRSQDVCALFAADLFNEGLDLPEVDTVLFLRPTESATLFLQQLGRGLRRTRDKAVLTVLDFVGHHRADFRFDQRLRALTGATRRELEREVDRGFPFLPSGCQIVMDRQSQALVLENLRQQVGRRWAQLVAELRQHPTDDLATFLAESGLELSDVLRDSSHTWTSLRRAADLPTRPGSRFEAALLKRVRAVSHVDDPERAELYRQLLSDTPPSVDSLSPVERGVAAMLFFTLWPKGGDHRSVESGLSSLGPEGAAREELSAVIDIAYEQRAQVTTRLPGRLADVPLRVHGRYLREEILAGLRHASMTRLPSTFREGVLYLPDLDVDAFFVTLDKSESDYSPTTRYRDYPVSPTLFHWESQSTTTIGSPTGQRYLRGTSTKLIFVRQRRASELGTSPYLCAGPAHYVQHKGERPIAITWRLEQALPNEFFTAASVAAP